MKKTITAIVYEHLLVHGPMTSRQLQEALSIPCRSMVNTLQGLRRRGLIESDDTVELPGVCKPVSVWRSVCDASAYDRKTIVSDALSSRTPLERAWA